MASDAQYTMLGFDDNHTPTVATNVTIDQAKDIAKAKDLNGMLLAPQVPGQASHRTYMRDEEGHYEVKRMHVWLSNNLTSCSGAEVLGTDRD